MENNAAVMRLFREKMFEKPKYKGAAACWLTLLCVCTAFIQPLYNGDIDNYIMALVANKTFLGNEQDVYICYLHPILAKLMEGLHTVIPSADSFTLLANLMLFIAIWAAAYVLAHMVSNYYALLGCYSLIYVSVLMKDLFHYNFTRWAGFFGAVGALLLLKTFHQREDIKRWRIGASVLLSFGMMWRYETLLIFVPYVLFDAFIQVLFRAERKEERKQMIVYIAKTLALPVLCVVLLFVSDLAVRNSEKYREAIAYDNARSAVVDFHMEAWENVNEKLPGVSKNDYDSVRNWVLMDTERVDTQFLLNMSEAGKIPAYELSLQSLVAMQKAVISVFLESSMLMYTAVLLIILLGMVMLSNMAWFYKVEALVLCIGTDLIFLVFVYAGRAIERVYIAVLYALLVSVGVLLLTEAKEKQKIFVNLMKGALLGIIGIGILAELQRMDVTLEQSVFVANQDVNNLYEASCVGDALYIWRVGTYVNEPVASFMQQGKLLPAEFMQHNIYDGAWSYGQVYFTEMLEQIQAPNPMEALLARKNTYYVADDCNYVFTYLQENYKSDVMVEQVDEIDGIPVWEFK